MEYQTFKVAPEYTEDDIKLLKAVILAEFGKIIQDREKVIEFIKDHFESIHLVPPVQNKLTGQVSHFYESKKVNGKLVVTLSGI